VCPFRNKKTPAYGQDWEQHVVIVVVIITMIIVIMIMFIIVIITEKYWTDSPALCTNL
jgi:heme/copper-type cytochrome/quinol oxidase subunit 2